MSRVRYYKTTTQRVGNTTYKTVQSRRWGGPYDQPSGCGTVVVFCLAVVFLFWPAMLPVPTWAKWVLEIVWLLVLFAAILAGRKKPSAAKTRAVLAPNLPPPPSPRGRVSDAERTQVTDALSDQFAKGRLDLDEFDKRLDHALQAKTRADLAAALSDPPNGQQKAAARSETTTVASRAATPPGVRRPPSSPSAKPAPEAQKKATVPPVRVPTPAGAIVVPRRRPAPSPAQPVPQQPTPAPSSFMPPPYRELWAQMSDGPFPEVGTPAFAALSRLWREELERLHATPEYKTAVQKEYELLRTAAKPSQPKDEER